MITSSNSAPGRLRRLGLQAALIIFVLTPSIQAQMQQGTTTATSPSSGSSQLTNSSGDTSQSANPLGGGVAESAFNTGSGQTARTGIEGDSGGAQSFDMHVALSTDQIFAILQEQPDALVVLDDFMACGVVLAARQLNLRVPDHLGLVSFNDSSLCNLLDVGLTSVSLGIERIVQAAVSKLLQVIEQDTSDIQVRHIVPCELKVRGSSLRPAAVSA